MTNIPKLRLHVRLRRSLVEFLPECRQFECAVLADHVADLAAAHLLSTAGAGVAPRLAVHLATDTAG